MPKHRDAFEGLYLTETRVITTKYLDPRKIPTIQDAIKQGKRITFGNSGYNVDRIIFEGSPEHRIAFKDRLYLYAYAE